MGSAPCDPTPARIFLERSTWGGRAGTWRSRWPLGPQVSGPCGCLLLSLFKTWGSCAQAAKFPFSCRRRCCSWWPNRGRRPVPPALIPHRGWATSPLSLTPDFHRFRVTEDLWSQGCGSQRHTHTHTPTASSPHPAGVPESITPGPGSSHPLRPWEAPDRSGHVVLQNRPQCPAFPAAGSSLFLRPRASAFCPTNGT